MESFTRFISNRALILYIQLKDFQERYNFKSYTRSVPRASFDMPSLDVPFKLS